MAVKIADGFVEISGEVDEASVRQAAGRVVDSYGKAAERDGKRRMTPFFRALFTPDRKLLMTLIRPLSSILATPVGVLGGVLGGMWVAGFVAAVAGSAALAGLPAVFAALGLLIVGTSQKSFADLFDQMMAVDTATLNMSETLRDANKVLKDGAKSLDLNTQAGHDNVKAALSLVQGYRDVYDSQVASGVAVDVASAAYNENVEALRKQLRAMGFNAAQVDQLIAKYKQVPTFLDKIKSSARRMMTVLATAAAPMVASFTGAMAIVESVLKERLAPKLMSIWTSVAKFVGPLVAAGLETVNRALAGIDKALGSATFGTFINQFTQHLPRLGQAIGEFFQFLGRYSDLIGAAFGVVVTIIQKLIVALQWIIVLGAGVLLVFRDMWDGLTNGVGSISNIGTAFKSVGTAIGNVLTALQIMTAAVSAPDKAQAHANLHARLLELWTVFKAALLVLWTALWSKIKEVWASTVAPWLKTQAAALLDYLIALFIAKLGQLKNAAVQKVIETVTGIIVWFATLPNRVLSAIASIPGIVAGVFGRIHGVVLAALAGAAGWLYNAGAAIIGGLIAGINSRIGDVGAAVAKAAAIGAKYLPGSPVKAGPLRVLNDGYAGKMIARMLASGMRDATPLVYRASANLADAAAFAPSLATRSDTEYVHRSNVQHFHITTQEIDPRKHSAELGWQLQGMF